MLKRFIKYVSQNMLGMLGMSFYILADTFFISKAVGARPHHQQQDRRRYAGA